MYKNRYDGLKAGTWQPQPQRRVQCVVDGCDRLARYRTPIALCQAHHQQAERGVPFSQIRPRNLPVDGTKKCPRCKEIYAVANFYKKLKSVSTLCRGCTSILNRANTYGISFDEMKTMLDGVCAGCGVTQSPSGRRLHVDHCHPCGGLRGLLCHECNTTLTEHMTPTILRTLAEYLEAHSVDH